jgi:aspartyl/asparaginyl beta-hydroxylase (cupin superfamily)
MRFGVLTAAGRLHRRSIGPDGAVRIQRDRASGCSRGPRLYLGDRIVSPQPARGEGEALLSRVREAVVWWKLRRKALSAGIDTRTLGRVREHIRSRVAVSPRAYADPLQRPRSYFPGLTARPWHHPRDFPWTRHLEAAHSVIKEELLALRNTGRFQRQPEGLADTGAWNVYYLYFLGHQLAENCARCPSTTRVLRSIPGATSAGLVYFSALTPGTTVRPHCGPTNTRLRCHFACSVPRDCGIRVGAESRVWEEGRCLVFDDSFEHEVWNGGEETRIVLLLDIWHPDLTPAERYALEELTRMSRSVRKTIRTVEEGRGTVATDEWWIEQD